MSEGWRFRLVEQPDATLKFEGYYHKKDDDERFEDEEGYDDEQREEGLDAGRH